MHMEPAQLQEDTANITLIKTEHAFSIAIGGKEYMVFAMDEDTLCAFVPGLDDITFCNTLDELPENPIQVSVRDVTQTRVPVGTRPADQEPTETEPAEVTRLTPEHDAARQRVIQGDRFRHSPLEQFEREQILNLFDGYTPPRTARESSKISHEIADEVFGEDSYRNVMRVAGVRSALTKGHYDNV